MRVENLHEKVAEGLDVSRREGKALHKPGNGVQAKGNLRDDSKSAERSGHKFVEIIAGDVLDDLATRARDGAIREHDRHANDEVAKASVSEAKASRVVGSSDAADRCAIWPEGVEGDKLTVLRKRLLHGRPYATGLNDAGHVLPCVFAHGVETVRVEDQRGMNRVAPALFGAASQGSDGDAVPVGIPKHCRDLFRARRSDAESIFVNANVFGTADCGEIVGEGLQAGQI